MPSAQVANGFFAEYFAQIKLYGHGHIGIGGGGQDAICYAGGGHGANWSEINNPGTIGNGPEGGLHLVSLRINSSMENSTSAATLSFRFINQCNNGFTGQAVYSCPYLACSTGGVFTLTNNAPGFPARLEVKPHDRYYSEVNDQGPCPYGNCIDVDWEPSRPTYSDETKRLQCCDPFCSCAPGSIQIFCSGKGAQLFGGCSAITFCTGGRTGRTSPSGPSREYCVTAIAADGSSHTICCVVYCSNGQWLSEWYCDGTFAGVGTGGTSTCCPFSFTQDMPSISCLPGCTGCVAINADPTCSGPGVPCCDPAGLPSTMTIYVYSTCWGNFSCTLTGTGGGVYSTTCNDAHGASKNISFTAGVSPCVVEISLPLSSCPEGDDGVVKATMTAVTCGSSPTFTNSSIAQSACICTGSVTNVVITA